MNYWRAVIFGLVQGLTEFLPVSSSGHLLLLECLSLPSPSVFLQLALHLATLFAVLVVMRREVWALLRHPVRGDLRYVCIASVPTVIIAIAIETFCPALTEGVLLPFSFFVTSALLVLAGVFAKGRTRDISLGNSLLVGVAQGVAVLPGISRSGATISVLRMSGVEWRRATGFSFLLSLPVIAGGFIWEGVKSGFSVQGVTTSELLLASAVAFLSGLVAAKFMLRGSKGKTIPFAVYTFGMGVLSFFLL